ncbi:MAG: hypothetical protein K2N78_11885 [Oscillospiraceae bacterium]|nr:hypothetical protein [Oscillospiraceae bacterium]
MWNWICAPLFLAVLGILIYLLYRQGFVMTKSIAAVLFMLYPGKNGDRATLNSCSGWARHAVRFRESRIYDFAFDCQLTNGDAEVLLLDRDKKQLLRLNRYQPSGRAALDPAGRYYLRWEFKSATGTCNLRW